MKLILGIVLGISALISCGMTYVGWGVSYDITYAAHTESLVDVRLINLDGHDYVVATSCVPGKTSPLSSTHANNRSQAFSSSFASVGSCSITLMHHVGCKTCCKTSAQ